MATATHHRTTRVAVACALTVALACEQITGTKPSAKADPPHCIYRGDTVGLLTRRDSTGRTTECIYLLSEITYCSPSTLGVGHPAPRCTVGSTARERAT